LTNSSLEDDAKVRCFSLPSNFFGLKAQEMASFLMQIK